MKFGDTSLERCQSCRCDIWGNGPRDWLLLIPLGGIRDFVSHDLVFGSNLGPESISLVLYDLGLSTKYLIKSGPFRVDLFNTQPVCEEIGIFVELELSVLA